MNLIENISIMEVDWDGIAASKDFGDRSGKNLKEQFQRTIYPALVDELEARSILLYRQNLLTAIREQGPHCRQQIDWAQLQGRFWPKTKAILVGFLQLISIPIEGNNFPLKITHPLSLEYWAMVFSS